MNDDDLVARLRRLRPAGVPAGLQRRLHAAEPPARTAFLHPHLSGWFATWLRPWPLAYAGLGAAWLVILALRLLTQAPSPADHYGPVAQSSDARTNPAPTTLAAGFSADRAFLLTRNNNPDATWR